MADTIKGNEVIEDDHLKNPIKSAEDLTKAYLGINEAVLKLTTDIAALNKDAGGKQTAKNIQAINKALVESTNVRKNSIAVDKQKLALDKQLKAATDENVKAKLRLQRANKKQRDDLKDIIILEDQEATATEKLLAKNRQLSRERDKLTGATRKERREIRSLNKSIDSNNAKIDKNSDKMKKQRRGIGNYSKAVNGLRGGLAKLGLAFGVFTLIKDSFNVIKDFDQAQADLSSVLGVSREAMSALTEQAKELGATTKFTASQVSELQLEYAKLGFTQKEIDNVTGSTLELAAAAGTDLANAATITGSTLRGFGLDSTETQRVVDVMAKSFSSSSLDIEKFKTAMAAVAPVAKAAGVDLERTTALLGTLTDRGIDASSAGTGLRNMFLSATAAGITFDEALEQVRNAQDKTAKSLELFGKKGATLGVILAENGADVTALEAKLNDAGGAAKEMADKQLDTLAGSLDLLRSAWEGFILGADGASGASETLKNIVKFLADNLNTILNTIGALVTAFGVYKTVTKAIEVSTKVWTAAQWLLNIALNANPIGLIVIAVTALIAGIAALTVWMDSWTSSTEKLTTVQKRNNLINERALEIGKELLYQNKEEISDLSVLIDALNDENTTREEKNEIIAKLNEDYPELIENIDLESASTEQLIQLKRGLITQILNESIERKKAEALALLTGQIIDKELKKIGSGEKGIKQLQKEIDELTAFIPLIDEIATKIKENVQSTVEGIDFSGAFREENDKIRALQEELLELNKRFANAQTDLERETIQKRINEVQEELTRELSIRQQMLDDALDKEKSNNEESLEDYEKTQKGKTKILMDESAKQEKILFDLRQKLKKDEEDQQKENLKILEKNEEERLKKVEQFNKDQEKLEDQRNKQRKDAEKKRVEDLKEMRDTSLSIIKQITDGIRANIDRRIASRQQEIDASKEEVLRLQAIGTANAAEAIKAEKVEQAREKVAIERLERRKRNLLLSVATLERVSQLIGAGNGNPIETAKSEFADLISSLPKLFGGTDTTVAAALGAPHLGPGKDGYIARLDGKEGVLTGNNMSKLNSVGLNTMDEITNSAMKYQTMGMAIKALDFKGQVFSSASIVSKLDNVEKSFEKAIDNIEINETHIDVEKLMAKIVGKNNIKNVDYSKGGLWEV